MKIISFRTIAVVVTGLVLAKVTCAQCGEWDNRYPDFTAPQTQSCDAAVFWDPDGLGPEPEQLHIAGTINGPSVSFGSSMSLSRFDGKHWFPVSSINGSVNALCVWDPDGAGPERSKLIVGGTFLINNVSTRIAAWDGSAWSLLGGPANAIVRSLTTWDPDDNGPLLPLLIAGGDFTAIGTFSVTKLGAWNGLTWQTIGGGIGGTVLSGVPRVQALSQWDPDGSGPQGALLAVGGEFSLAGTTPASRIALWNGVAWQAAGSGVSTDVAAIASYDPDGAGPSNPQLVVGGGFLNAGGQTANYIASWDGTQWQSLANGANGNVLALANLDPDGGGPLNSVLVAGGLMTQMGDLPAQRIAQWNGTQWSSMDGLPANDRVRSLCVQPNAGNQPQRLIAGLISNDTSRNGLIQEWNGSGWLPLGQGLDDSVVAMTSWDHDGSADSPARIVVGGKFTWAGATQLNHIALLDGEHWEPLGSGFGDVASNVPVVNSLKSWDTDGAGPLTRMLFAGGSFTTAGGIPANRIAQWDGSQWSNLLSGLEEAPFQANPAVNALTTFDPDGQGPAEELLVVGGYFTRAGGIVSNHIASWNGVAWSPMATGVSNAVYALMSFDPDQSGPQPALLVAGGSFVTASGVTANGVAAWNGSTWLNLGTGLNTATFQRGVLAFALWDSDGAGALPPQLFAGGDFVGATNVPRYLGRWDGAAWQRVSVPGLTQQVNALSISNSGEMYAVTGAPSDTSGRLIRFNGSSIAFLGQVGAPVQSICVAATQPGGSAEQVFIGGNFRNVGTVGTGYFARWSTLAPQVILEPSDTSATVGDTITLDADFRNGQPIVQWFRNDVVVVNGLQPGGTTAYGANTPNLILVNAQPSESGVYRAVATNSCGQISTNSATVTIAIPLTCDSIDFNNDTSLFDPQDIEAFLSVYSEGPCVPASATCSDIDFNNDTSLFDPCDINSFLVMYSEGPCTPCGV
ncbi:MAG: immunoglobulin domain-containing protein [Phycisphaerales bacterium]